MVAFEPETVSRLMVSALPPAPESILIFEAPAVAVILPPFVKLTVGELTDSAAPLPIVWVVPPKDMEAPVAWELKVTVPVLAWFVAAARVWLPVNCKELAPATYIRMAFVPEVAD